jgi:hypothetical protein
VRDGEPTLTRDQLSRIETVRRSIALAVAVNRHGLGMSYERRRIGRIFLSSRRSFESRILLNRQCAMENITLNDRGAV